MLAADKLQLQSALKQQATALKEKEFNLHHSNLMTVGTQAAVLAGLDITMFIEFSPPHEREWDELKFVARAIKLVYYIMIVSGFCANMLVVSHTTVLSVLGAGLALRGPDGSMLTATDGLYEERASVFQIFGYGLGFTVGSVVLGVWLLLNWESALACMLITLVTCRQIWVNYLRVQRRFSYNESETVDLHDLMEGPGAIQAVPSFVRRSTDIMSSSKTSKSTSSHKRRTKGGSSSIAKAPSSANGSFFSRSSARGDSYRRVNSSTFEEHVEDVPSGDESDDIEYQMTSKETSVQRRRGGGKSSSSRQSKANSRSPMRTV
mmetsp:Transcript_12432/g.34258  ORF Transcript_12432/g.34258 Transcript_12432/m.34258 type:complete len:320 (-) Transcript_12432:216-1175(-)